MKIYNAKKNRSIRASRRAIKAAADITNMNIIIDRSGFVEVYEDSYERGEGDFANEWDFDIEGTYNTIQVVIDEIANSTGATNDPNDYVFIDGRIDTDMEQNANGDYPSDEEFEAWKRGELQLYVAHIGVPLKVGASIHEMTEDEAEAFGLSVY